MKRDVVVPEVGESITEGVLARWVKADGERVAEGDTLYELETEKTTVEVPAASGGVLHIATAEGSRVTIGQVVGTIDTEAADAAASPAPPKGEAAPDAPGARSDAGPGAAAAVGQPPQTAARAVPALSPAVRRILAENSLDPSAVKGRGKGGRITKADALEAARRAAGVRQQESAARAVPAAPPAAAVAAARIKPAGVRTTRRVPMSPIRKATSRRLLEARRNAAHVTTFNEIDMSKVMEIRRHYREDFEREHGIGLGYMSFFVKACCQALATYPSVNAMVDGHDIVYNDFCDIGVAVSLDKGLVVPVIRDAQAMHFADIEAAVADFAKRARGNKLVPAALEGGTFTITNGGVFGSLMSTPIPAYPQTAILGMHAIRPRPVAVDGAVEVRPMMYAALSYDHGIVDGKEAVGFLVRVKDFIEEPDKLLLEM
jgi:2-oxoglutarate dehydrogenase E2 component (dihydrolipoamide succinyltransferase)